MPRRVGATVGVRPDGSAAIRLFLPAAWGWRETSAYVSGYHEGGPRSWPFAGGTTPPQPGRRRRGRAVRGRLLVPSGRERLDPLDAYDGRNANANARFTIAPGFNRRVGQSPPFP